MGEEKIEATRKSRYWEDPGSRREKGRTGNQGLEEVKSLRWEERGKGDSCWAQALP